MKKMTAMLLSLAVGLNTVSMAAKADTPKEQETDVLLIGGGIMSATLGTYLQELQPDWSMTMVERLDGVAQESSNGWNTSFLEPCFKGNLAAHFKETSQQHRFRRRFEPSAVHCK